MAKKETVIMDSIEFNSKDKIKRRRTVLNELESFSNDTILPSEIFNKKKDKEAKNKKSDTKNIDKDESVDNDWFDSLTNFKTVKPRKADKSLFKGFNKKDKKEKNKKKNEVINHKKDFEPEMALFKNLQMEQSKFVDSLQKKYNQMENTKATSRGVGKFTTDLIDSINTARSVSMQLVDKIVSIKKTIADLDFKERKEFGSKNTSEQENMASYASTYLKQVMDVGRNNIVGNQQQNYTDYSSEEDSDSIDDLFDSINESLSDVERDEDSEKYLKYENDGIEVKVIWHESLPDDSDSKYEYVAYNKHGNVVSDYPLPEKTKLSINKATKKATDMYGNKYDMELD